MMAARSRPARRYVFCSTARGGVVAGMVAGVLGVICGAGAAAATGTQAVRTRATSLPLATVTRTKTGTWATLPMGHLTQPLNTYWQLMFEPAGSAAWSDRVEATGVATNGGIVLAANAKALLVGVLPSYRLTYSPLIATTNSGRSWTTGLLENGLAHVPSALALSPSGTALALGPGAGGGREVLDSRAGRNYLVAWQRLLASRTFSATTAGHGCSPTSFTAVGYAGTTPVVGAACGRTGSPGLFAELGGRWKAEGPRTTAGAGSAQVLGLVPAGKSLAAVIEMRPNRPGAVSLLSAWSPDGTTWRASGYLRLPVGERIISLGPAAGEGAFVLMANRGGKRRLAEVAGPGSRSWRYLPEPPAGTETVAFGAAGGAQALAVNQSAMQVWDITGGSGAGGSGAGGAKVGAGWRRGQVLRVPIQYGSSG